MPSVNNSPEFLTIAKVVRVTMAAGYQCKYRHHVGGNLCVYSPQRGQIEAATVRCIPSTQQKVDRPSDLSGIGLRYLDESLQHRLLQGSQSSPQMQCPM